jgi:cytochrome c-type biogenesis protein CcmH
VTVEQPIKDPAQERIAQAVFHALKCVVCEGQALSESDAPLAHQMREEIRRMVAQGKSKAEVLDYFTARYGQEVLLSPPLSTSTVLLWLAPLVLVGFGAWITRRILQK